MASENSAEVASAGHVVCGQHVFGRAASRVWRSTRQDSSVAEQRGMRTFRRVFADVFFLPCFLECGGDSIQVRGQEKCTQLSTVQWTQTTPSFPVL